MKQQEVEDSEEFYEQLQEEELATLKKHARSRKATRSARGNSKTDSLYKEALMDSIFGRFQEASRKLKLMITLSPDTPEPYHLLGTMHEQNGELDKAAEYLFMSTYLSPPSLEKWLKVGELSFQQKMYSQAAYCFGRALKIASYDPKIMVRRAEAFELAGQSKKAIATYKRLLEISQAPDYIKKYAKLRYRRGEYSSCRQILKSLENFMSDSQLVYMICETYLQEHSYEQAAQVLEQHLELKEENMQQNEQLLPEFIILLLICSVALGRDCYGFSAEILLSEAKQCYEEEYSDLYSETIHHLSKFSEPFTFEFVSFLIKYPQHQKITNYLLVTDYLCKQKDENCLKVLESAFLKYPHSPQLLAQRDYIFNCFGIGGTLKDQDAIFYSDEDEPLPIASHQKKTIAEPADTQIMEKLIQNVEEALRRLAEEINKGNSPGIKEQQTVMDGLQLFISLAPNNKEQEGEEKEGLYIKKTAKKRGNDGQSKTSLINDNIAILMRYFQSLVFYLKGLLSHKQWRKLIQVGQKVSKVHVFKNHSKLTQFTSLKIQIYEMCVLSCLAVNKFNTALFFLRYLVTKHPQDPLYVLATHLLMRICPKKTFLSSALSKRLGNPGGEHLARLLAVEYMQTGCFELAISALLRSNKPGESLSPAPQLCLAACLIQIASSRNTYNKLDFTNRSALCLASYNSVCEKRWQTLFNKGRWFAQTKVNHKAIACFKKLLQSEADIKIKERAAYCLICIYRECDQFQKADRLSSEYFPLPEPEQAQQDIVETEIVAAQD